MALPFAFAVALPFALQFVAVCPAVALPFAVHTHALHLALTIFGCFAFGVDVQCCHWL